MDELLELDALDDAANFADEYDLELLDVGEFGDDSEFSDAPTYSAAAAKAAA